MDNGAGSYHRFLEGDKNGLEEIVKMYNISLIFFINGFVNDLTASEDLAADTFLELILRKNRFVKDAKFKTWLFRIARNNAIDYLRKHSKYSIEPVENFERYLSEVLTLEESLLLNERKKQLHKIMVDINPEYREVLHLLYFEDMSYDEAAAVLKKNNKQIKNLVYRAKKSLKIALEKEGFNYEDL